MDGSTTCFFLEHVRQYPFPTVYATGMPQSDNNGNQEPSAGLPLIQFTNGGIRFNFGGYHAEAGLGGLLTGSRTGGGLHASAGTPWGAHAGAGLGGLLGGDNANAGGGLYARAGLGNGRPEAAAGLGGVLDGSGRSIVPARGGLFAGATTGARGVSVGTGTRDFAAATGAGVYGPNEEINRSTSKGINGSVSAGGKPVGSGSNIQIIAKKAQNVKQASSNAVNPEPKQKDHSSNKEIREIGASQPLVIASAGISGTLSVNPVPQGPLVPQPMEQVKVVGNVGTIEPAPPAPPLTSDTNEIPLVDKRPQRVRVIYPKWIRKRLGGPRKQIIYDTGVNVQSDPSDANTQKLSRRQVDEILNVPRSRTDPVLVQSGNSDGFYEDVFNIPVSTLNAVNRLLNNNFG
ncbi:uncharacterized protein LOC128887608 [Hylaeus anthracinus]|uniref:uncharacterized protein LOC128887608 n=1 Tax=Hylaeus anthracinus TaxID=313031 RepID=UPI0023B967FB|nr:uncharacterized protein LOC128887608 [Hylaeus anthracinus]